MGTEIGGNTFKLFKKRPSFMDGFSGLVSCESITIHYHISATDEIADSNAIQSDWSAVGEDMADAIKDFKSKYVKS